MNGFGFYYFSHLEVLKRCRFNVLFHALWTNTHTDRQTVNNELMVYDQNNNATAKYQIQNGIYNKNKCYLFLRLWFVIYFEISFTCNGLRNALCRRWFLLQ